MQETKVFDKGEIVPLEGNYVCSPCGFSHHYRAGETFGECTSCMAGSDSGHPEYVDGSGLWEHKPDEPTEKET
ncbi:MAG: hypothetical protein HZC01_04980 [Candidatus Kerfeldbacteria bacterium]|nr:hypothetical protein [Candidatus Kerfeldbacteria bacterium]